MKGGCFCCMAASHSIDSGLPAPSSIRTYLWYCSGAICVTPPTWLLWPWSAPGSCPLARWVGMLGRGKDGAIRWRMVVEQCAAWHSMLKVYTPCALHPHPYCRPVPPPSPLPSRRLTMPLASMGAAMWSASATTGPSRCACRWHHRCCKPHLEGHHCRCSDPAHPLIHRYSDSPVPCSPTTPLRPAPTAPRRADGQNLTTRGPTPRCERHNAAREGRVHQPWWFSAQPRCSSPNPPTLAPPHHSLHPHYRRC